MTTWTNAAHITDTGYYDRESYLGLTEKTLTIYTLDARPERVGGPNPEHQSWATPPGLFDGFEFYGGQWGNGDYGTWHEFEIAAEPELVGAFEDIDGPEFTSLPQAVKEAVRDAWDQAASAEDADAAKHARELLDEAAETLRVSAPDMLAAIKAGDTETATAWWREHGGWHIITLAGALEDGLGADDDGRLCVCWGENIVLLEAEDADLINAATAIIAAN